MGLERLTVHYSGTVQGVGFRWTAINALRGLPVTGYVRNLTDGRVEMVVEGSSEDNQRALERVQGALGHLIRSKTQETAPGTGEFDAFGVRR